MYITPTRKVREKGKIVNSKSVCVSYWNMKKNLHTYHVGESIGKLKNNSYYYLILKQEKRQFNDDVDIKQTYYCSSSVAQNIKIQDDGRISRLSSDYWGYNNFIYYYFFAAKHREN